MTTTTGTPLFQVFAPKGNIDFTDNIIDSAKMGGGYSGYQLWPNGEKVTPVHMTSANDRITLANVNTVFCYKTDGAYDLYLCGSDCSFKTGETVEMIGPITNPETIPPSEFVQFKGRTSTQVVNFNLNLTTIPGGGTVGAGGAQPQPGGQYVLNVSVEHNGKVIFQTRSNI